MRLYGRTREVVESEAAKALRLKHRDTKRQLDALDRERGGLVYAWLDANVGRQYSSDDYLRAEKATAARRKEMWAEMGKLRDELKRIDRELKATNAADRAAQTAANKAKREAARTHDRDECQICCGTQAIDARGDLMHHGYARPGVGFIIGDCYGVGHKPFPAYDALELWATRIQMEIDHVTEDIAAHPTLTTIKRQVRDGYDTRGRAKYKTEPFPQPAKGTAERLQWDRLHEQLGHALAGQLRAAQNEAKRVAERIQAAKAEQLARVIA